MHFQLQEHVVSSTTVACPSHSPATGYSFNLGPTHLHVHILISLFSFFSHVFRPHRQQRELKVSLLRDQDKGRFSSQHVPNRRQRCRHQTASTISPEVYTCTYIYMHLYDSSIIALPICNGLHPCVTSHIKHCSSHFTTSHICKLTNTIVQVIDKE